MNTWRLVECPAGRGEWNMAVDEALAESVAISGECCLRFYCWSGHAVAGLLSELRCREAHAASRDCPLVRRATGGGAIVHDREITYSLAVPANHPLATPAPDIVSAVHEALIRALGNWRIGRHPLHASIE